MNKKVVFIGMVILLILVGGVLAYRKFARSQVAQNQQAAAPKKHVITDPVNLIAENDRPYVQVIPVDIHNISFQVNDLKKPADTAEFVLEYQTGSDLEGAQGSIDVTKLPSSKEILLGSCSAGGACTYHKDVQGGTLTLKFTGSSDSYALKSDWKYITNNTKDTSFSSKDALFQVTSKDLAKQSILVIYNTPGYPAGLTGTPVSEAYTLDTISPLSGKGSVQMRTKEAVTSAAVMGWDGKAWKEFPAIVDSSDTKSVTAQVDLMQLYVVVKKS